ncbi:hypothetical protein CJO82_19085 (plasmid) [Ralstonia solanacearum]|nr:hypothetical protein CJO82_19085 [Ralstonia solanacearum]AXW21165.1 hypothetical protein CJO85_19195 [Ralstonia solanacearum]AXW25765.1 hypothetical protein CJO86_19340 [Ralstonia solanacearum]AXW82675.1 hypothetical protein CJO98_19445 [Ralstonia solanacearum]
MSFILALIFQIFSRSGQYGLSSQDHNDRRPMPPQETAMHPAAAPVDLARPIGNGRGAARLQ